MAESKQTPLSEPEEPKRAGGSDSPRVQSAASPADTVEDTTDKGQDRSSCSPTRESAGDEKSEAEVTPKQETEITEHETTPKNDPDPSSPEKSVKPIPEATPEELVDPKQEIEAGEEVETKEPTPPVDMEMQPAVEYDDGSAGDAAMDAKCVANSEPKVAGAAVELKGESRKRSQSDHSRRSRSSSSSSTSSNSNGNSTSAEGRSNTSNSGGSSSTSNSDSEGASLAKKVKLEPVLEQRSMKQEEAQAKTETDEAAMDGMRITSQSPRSVGANETDDEAGISAPEVQPISAESLNREEEARPSTPSVQSSLGENVVAAHEKVTSKEAEQQNGSEEGSRTESLLLPPPPPPPPLPRVDTEVSRVVGKVSIVAPILERPDSARLTADLQSCQRQLAEVRSKYDVTRKELHATKRKLKRMSVRLGNMTSGGGGTASSGGIVGNASPHPLTVGTADEDRNRKWREPMIVAAMKIKTAMGIQAYKSLIKDGELLLPSLRTITRYLESLRKSGGGPAAAAAALANAGAAVKVTAPIEVDEVPEEEEEEDEEGEEDAVAVRADGMLQRRLEHTAGKKKQTKANGGGATGRTVDHNRNEQRRHPSYNSHQQRHHAPDVQLQDIKTEQDPVSFTASPDINYYQHNADDDDDEDEDGYQDPTSLLEESRYEEAGGLHMNGVDGSYHYGQQGQQPQQQQTLSQAQIEFLKSMVGFRKKWTPYELRTCNDIRRIIGSREYESLRRKDGMPLPSVKTLRKYRHAAHLPDGVDIMGRKRKHNEMDDSPTNQPRTVPRYGSGGGGVGGGGGDSGNGQVDNGSGVLFPFGNDTDKEQLKPEQHPESDNFDVSALTLPQISFLQILTMNTKGFSDYELQRSLELKNELGSDNYETLRKQEFLNIPTLAMLTRYEQDNGLEDLSRLSGRKAGGVDRMRRKLEESSIEAAYQIEEQRNRELEEQQAQEQRQQEQEQQRQLELYNQLTQADPSRHPLFDSIAGDTSPTEGADPALTAAAIAAAMAAAAAAGLHPSQLDNLNGSTAGGEDSSMSMFEHHSIFDKDASVFDMAKLSPAHVEFLNTLPENPKRWTQEMINSALDIKNEIGTRDYEILRRQGIALPAARTLRRHKDIRNKADRAMSETGEILPGSGSATPAGVVGGSG